MDATLLNNGLSDFGANFFTRAKKRAKKLVRSEVGRTVVGATKIAYMPIAIGYNVAKDVKKSGIRGLKKAPSRILYDPLKMIADQAANVARLTSSNNTIVSRLANKLDKKTTQAQTWTQQHPAATIGIAAAAAGAVVAAPFVAGAAGSLATSIGGSTMAATLGKTAAKNAITGVLANRSAAAKPVVAAPKPASASVVPTPVTPAAAASTAPGAGPSMAAIGAGAGAGLLVAGPIGAIVGAGAGALLGQRKPAPLSDFGAPKFLKKLQIPVKKTPAKPPQMTKAAATLAKKRLPPAAPPPSNMEILQKMAQARAERRGGGRKSEGRSTRRYRA